MRKRGKKTLMESATELAESLRPAIESAMETAVETAKDTVEKAAPILADGKKIAQEKAHRGRRRAAAKISALKEAEAAEKVAAFKAAEPEKEKGSKLKKLVLLTGLMAVGSVIFKRLRGAPSKSNWQSSYTPQPAPRHTPTHAATAESPAETPAPAEEAPVEPAPASDDAGAASPDEALSDRATEPHPDTTPDNPAEVVELHAVEDAEPAEAPEEAPAEAPAASQGGARKKS
jgi:hypothetical protein